MIKDQFKNLGATHSFTGKLIPSTTPPTACGARRSR